MKILLAILLCPVLVASQCFAIDGGPWGGGGGTVAVTGTYAGILVPIVDPIIMLPDNSLALFTFKVPQTGLATGTSAIFRNGFFYPGTIIGSADPDSGRLTAIVNASFSKTFTSDDGNGVAHDYTFNFNATGGLDRARIVPNSGTSSTASTRIRGKASITYTTENDPHNLDFALGDSGGPIQYKIRGFKQSESS